MSKGEIGERGAAIFDRTSQTAEALQSKSAAMEEAAEQKRIKLEQNIKYMQFEKEARQVRPFVCLFAYEVYSHACHPFGPVQQG